MPEVVTRGILLAGGRGTRLHPLSQVASKQLLPVYNKPMVYYPLTTMMLAGVREFLIVSTPHDLPRFRDLLGDGSQWGIQLTYAEQAEPKGIAEAFLIGEDFVGDAHCLLMLGDNLTHGYLDFLRDAVRNTPSDGATIFAYRVSNPREYGVVEFDEATGSAISLEEKPAKPRSPFAVPGFYVYGQGVAERARTLEASGRGELEITDLNRGYLDSGTLRVQRIGRGIAWFDTGTPAGLLEASSFVHAIETRQGLRIGSPEEAAVHMGYMQRADLLRCIEAMPRCEYRTYLEGLSAEMR